MAKKTSLSLIARSTLLLAVLTLPRTGSASVVRSWSMQHRWPQQTVYFYLDDQLDEETGDLWYRKATERPVHFTYDHSPRLWGVPLERAIFDGLNMLRRANPGLKFIRIDKNDAARFPTVVKVTKRPESSLFGMATTNGYGNGKSEQYEIRMNKWCHAGIMAHEMMHILGMAHIQSRADRDNYVVVFNGQTYLKGTASEFTVPDNLRTGHGNFNLLTRRRLLGGYDFGSIMHYSDSVMKKRTADRSLVIPKVTIGRRLRPGPLRGIEDSRPSTDSIPGRERQRTLVRRATLATFRHRSLVSPRNVLPHLQTRDRRRF